MCIRDRFNSSALLVQGASDLTIEGSGSVFLFHVGAGVLLRDCQRVTIRNATIAYDPPAGTQGQVTSVDPTGTSATVRVSAGFPSLKDFAQYGGGAMICYRWAVDAATLVGGCGLPTGSPGISTDEFEISGTELKVGQFASVYNRHGFTLDLVNCSHCTASQLEILSGSFMTVTEFGGEGANLYDRVTVARQPGPYSPLVQRLGTAVPQPLMSSNADSFHSYAVRQGPMLRGCRFHNAGDDFFNVHNELSVALPSNHSAVLYLVDTHIAAGFVDAPGAVYGFVNSLDFARAGDTVGLYQYNSFDPLSTAQILQIQHLANPSQQLIDLAGAALKSSQSMPQINISSHIYQLTLSTSVTVSPGGAFGDVLEIRGDGAMVTECDFRATTCNLGRWKSSDSTISKNQFGQAMMCNLEVTALMNWQEGPASIANVTIQANDFASGSCPNGSIHVGSMARQVNIEGNIWPAP
eukprot:TRINITY_DN2698_c0_g1_i1.p1 TRINITY_DN2698_c0_g1~~TRINITY_DN2698_c0_g1_i1.p1  ORF type:complete len:466 (-),score=67.48 TRINITY_DN2698_c0_g1_i1:530-1927(-)